MSHVEIVDMLVGASIKSAAILAIAGLVNATWRGSSASARHLVWTIGVASALAIPALGVIVARTNAPVVRVAVWTPARQDHPAVVSPAQLLLYTPRLDLSQPARAAWPDALDASTPITEMQSAPLPIPTSSVVVVSPAQAIADAPRAGPGLGDRSSTFIANDLVYLYLAGFLAALSPLIAGIIRLNVLARRARRSTNGRWVDLVSVTPSIAHFAGRVRIVESEDATMPMTWGILEPTLLVPAASGDWPDWKCRNILLHELAHVERRDCLTQFVAQLACAVYWFNPLVWVAAHRMRVERELACDDRVISAGSIASDYASNLLDVARSLRSPSFTFSTAIAMARPSQLSGRLLAVLDATRNRSGVTRGIRASVSCAAVAVVIPMSFIIPGASGNPSVIPTAAGRTLHRPATPVSRHTPTIVEASPPTSMMSYSFTTDDPASSPLPLISSTAPLASLQSDDCWASNGKGSTHISSSSNDEGDAHQSYNVRYTRDNCSLEVSADGKFTLKPDLSDIETMASNGWFKVEERIGRESHRIEIRRASNGSLDHQYWVNGDRTPFNDEARAWLARTLLSVERRTAVAASTRVPQLYRTGGLRGVMSEIALMDAPYAKSVYYKTLLDMGVSIDTNTLNTVVRQATTDLSSSDYYLAEVLSKLSSQPSVNEDTWRTFAQAAGTMKSDYYKSEVLKKVLKSGRLSTQTVGILLNSASGIKSDYYLSELLRSVASQYAVNADTRQFYVNSLHQIESDYYRAQVVQALNGDGAWDAKTSGLVLSSVGEMKSDYYRSEALRALVKAHHVNDWPTFFNSVVSIPSGYYQKETLTTVLAERPLSRDAVAGVLGVAGRMKSDNDISDVLDAVARSYRIDDSLRPAYEKAVDAISSDYYRGSALSALRRSMAR
ncbi:MAG: M56 family metallopeptidase [Gemmatimonadales bacterium]